MTDGPHARVEWFTVTTKTCPVSTVNFQLGIWEAFWYRFCVLYSVNCCRGCSAVVLEHNSKQAAAADVRRVAAS
jgi:hypothetical protein